MVVAPAKAYKGMAMEGMVARWYARNTGKSMDQYRQAAQEVAGLLPSGGDVLEVAPGPGFLAIELAKLGPYRVVGLDISKTFVQLATDNAAKAGVSVNFHVGNASAMPFRNQTFDIVYCRAAFKNFTAPVAALDEMYRVLRPNGLAVINDLRRDAPNESIKAAVKEMNLGWFNSLMTRWILQRLRKQAYSPEDFRTMAAQTPFQSCDIACDPIGMTVTLRR